MRSWALAALVCVVLAGCVDREPKFDLVPGPIGVGLLWSGAGADGCLRDEAAWRCLDEHLDSYRRDYANLVRRDATPLLESFRKVKSGPWRQDLAVIERLVSQQASMLRSIELLDETFFAALGECGVDAETTRRLRVERAIERRRIVIEGVGPSIIDLRTWLDDRTSAAPAVAAILDDYASQLAELLAPLHEAERQRPLRHRRAVERLEAEAAARSEPGSEDAEKAREREGAKQAANAVRRELAKILELDRATIERLRAAAPAESFARLETRWRDATDAGFGGTGGDPAVEWQAEIAGEAASLSESQRRAVRDRLERYRRLDRELADALLEAMRSGRAIGDDDPRRAKRNALRKEFIEAVLASVPEGPRQRLAAIRNLSQEEKGALVMEIAPSSAAALMARMPPSLRSDPPSTDELPQRPDDISLLFHASPADEAWLRRSLERLDLPADRRAIAEQLWRDDALTALRALEPLHQATRTAESQIGRSLSDRESARRAIAAYLAAVDREREVIAAAEERYFDSLSPLMQEHERERLERLRWQRRLARERIAWRWVPFGDGLGFGSESSVTVVDALALAPLEPHEREIAEALLDERLPELVAGEAAFRTEGTRAIQRLVDAIVRAQEGDGRTDERLRAALPAIAESARGAVERRNANQLAAIDEIASALGDRGRMLRSAWRRAAHPEYFLDDAVVVDACAAARRRARGDEPLERSVGERILRFEREVDDAERALMEARRNASWDSPPQRRDEVRERLRDWPELAMAAAFRREVIGRLLRDLACLTNDPAIRGAADAWFRPREPRILWVYD